MVRQRLRSASYDTLIEFQYREREGAQNPVTGTYSAAEWRALPVDPEEWAEVQDVLPGRGESVDGVVSQSVRRARVRCHWRDDITSDMRIVIEDGSVMQIVTDPATFGRRDELQFMVEDYSSEGVAP